MLILQDCRLRVKKIDDVVQMLQGWLKTVDAFDREKEHFIVIQFNTRLVVRQVEVVTVGIINSCMVHPREVFKAALLANASAVLLAHNHPSGDPTPSPEDDIITHRLVLAGVLLGIEVLDHVVICDGSYVSYKATGRL